MHFRGNVAHDHFVDHLFNKSKLFLCHLAEVAEVEPKAFRRDKGTFLLNVIPQDLAKGVVHEVGGSVVVCSILPGRGINHCPEGGGWVSGNS
jgi:hypothetical protein